MNEHSLVCTEQDFLRHFVQNAPQLMWFLGAGASRTAGMPSATDITWDLKRQYYCRQENQDLQAHDLNNKAIRRKVQDYLDSRGFPALGSPEEYSFYFDLTFGSDYASQQQYISERFDPAKISLNLGHRVFAALLEMGLARVAFTTNFDEVVETAMAAVAGKSMAAFHLEGSYAALDALNRDQFPIYAKVHGDFRYRSIKNLSADLRSNDEEIQKCFLAAANRYGLIVSGYGGRDKNVMTMFREALAQNNPFPQGLYWTTPRLSEVAATVKELVDSARSEGVRAYIVETGTFDIMLSKMWRQLPNRPKELDLKVRPSEAGAVSIPLPPPGSRYPILRMNALAITECPRQCAAVDYAAPMTFRELGDRMREHHPDAILSYTDRILFWGNRDEVCGLLDKDSVRAIESYTFDDPAAAVSRYGYIKSFFEQALARSLCSERPLKLELRGRTHYAVVARESVTDPSLQPIKDALASQIAGPVPGLNGAYWAEALSLKLEERRGSLWLLLEPDLWISPLSLREGAADFLRIKRLHRYNRQSYQLLSAWVELLLGPSGNGQEASVSCFLGTDYAPTFRIRRRTAYSAAGGAHG